MEQTLQIKNLNIVGKFKTDEKIIVSDVNFSVAKKEKVAIVGESGSGKTMTAMSIFGLLPRNCVASGEIIFENSNLLDKTDKEMSKIRGEKIVMIPSGAEFLNPVLTVKTQIFESLKKLGIKDKTQMNEIATKKLACVGFDNTLQILDMYGFMLSGGMAQRVVIAIASCANPSIVLADELTKGIDSKTANMLVDTLEETFSNSAIIIITHDISLAHKCDKTLVMWGGNIVEFGKTSEVLNNPLHHYTKSLIASLPKNNFQIDEVIDKNISVGCPFASYCKKATTQCFEEVPSLREIDGRKVRCINA